MNTPSAPARRATWHDAFDRQMELWRFTRSPEGMSWLIAAYRHATSALSPDTQKLAASLYENENDKLFSADPVFVSAEMCEVVEAASASFKPEPLLPTDLLTQFGFVLYEKPFEVKDRFNEPTTIAAISWSPMMVDLKDDDVRMDGIALTIYAVAHPDAPVRILPMHLTPWWFSMSFGGNEVDENDVPTGAEWWWKIAQTTLRLMQQRISARHGMRPDRACRREAVRRGFGEREVVVVRLRRESGPGSEEPASDANYSHRFIVSGHWRNQWYPASGLHRQIWISPYVKGDESLPLVIRPRRVFTWDR